MKGNKIIATSIASMMLVAGMAMPKAFATDGKTAVRYAKEYLASDTYAIAVGLSNGDTDLTRSELDGLVKKYGVSIIAPEASADSLVKSGDKITLSTGRKATVVVYGDVEANGKIDLNDAQAAYDHARGNVTLSNDVALKSGDVETEASGNNTVDLNDVQRIYDYVRGRSSSMEDGLIVNKSKLPADSTNLDSNIELALSADYINNVNETDFSVRINLAKPVQDGTKYTLKVLDEKGAQKQTQLVEFTSDLIYKDVALNSFASYDDQEFTIVLVDKNDNVVASTTVQKVSKETLPRAVQIKTYRQNATTGKLGLSAFNGTDIVKVYYVVDSQPSDPIAFVKDKKTKTLSVSGNKLELTNLDAELSHEKAHTVYFVVENAKGNISSTTTTYSAIIAKDTVDVTPANPATSITASATSDGEKVTITPSVTAASSDIVISLYDENGNLVEEKYSTPTTFEVTKPGSYKVGVVVKGTADGTKTDSAELKTSKSIDVKQLDPVSNIQFEDYDDETAEKLSADGKLTWSGKDDSAINQYRIELRKFDGEKFPEVATSTEYATKVNGKLVKEKNIANLTKNTLYKATVVAETVGNVRDDSVQGDISYYLNSEPVTMEKYFFVLDAGVINVSSKTAHSMTLSVDKSGFNLGDEKISYDVEVWTQSSASEDADAHWVRSDILRNVVPTSDSTDTTDYLLVDGLDSYVQYRFVLVLKVGNAEGKTPRKGDRTYRDINLSNLTVAAASELKDDAVPEGKVLLSGSTLYVGSEKIGTGSSYEDQALIQLLKSLLKNALVADDVISISDSKVAVTFNSRGTQDSGDSQIVLSKRDFGNLGEKVLELTAPGQHDQKIVATAAKKVVLKGSTSRFDLSDLVADEIVVESGVVVTKAPASEFTLQSNAKVGNVNVDAQGSDAKLSVDTTDGTTITVSKDNTADSLTFTNEAKEDVKLVIEKDASHSESTLESITIEANGSVTVSPEVKVSGKIKVSVTNGNVTLKNDHIAGDLEVTMNKTTTGNNTIRVKSSRVVPEGLKLQTGVAYELKQSYEDTELTTEEDRATLVEFLRGFGYTSDQKVTLTVNTDGVAIFTFAAPINTTLNFLI